VDWERPYITQVARFDPSKGIPDVLLAYQKLYSKYIDAFLPPASDVRALVCILSHLCLYSRSFSNHSRQQQADEDNGGSEGWERLDEELQLEARLPQLIICGHGSVDDPDGNWVCVGVIGPSCMCERAYDEPTYFE